MNRLNEALLPGNRERWERMMTIYSRYMRNIKKSCSNTRKWGWMHDPISIEVYAAPDNYDDPDMHGTDTSYNCNID